MVQAREWGTWDIFNTISGEFCPYVTSPSHRFEEPPPWSSSTFCLVGNHDREFHAWDLSVDPPIKGEPYFSRPANGSFVKFHPSGCAFVPGTRDLVKFDEDERHSSFIKHWVYNVSTRRSECHEVTGLGSKPTYSDSIVKDIAWHPTLTSAKIYALSDIRRGAAALHLIDAKRHCLLSSWTKKEFQAISRNSHPVPSGHFMKWSPDGKKLALSNFNGTIILSFASGHAL